MKDVLPYNSLLFGFISLIPFLIPIQVIAQVQIEADKKKCQTLASSKDDNPLNGVTTYDLVLISKHILGLEALDSPYKMIAADVNKSGGITGLDIAELRKLILGTYQVFPDVPSWRFIPKNYVFPDPTNPWSTLYPAFPEVADLSLLLSPSLIEFYGVKVGDVNGSALTSVVSNTSEDREANNLPLGYNIPAGSRRGNNIEIPLFVQQATDLAAWQLALHYDTAQWQIKGVRWAMSAEPTIYQMADWHSPVPGEVRLCWFDRTGTATHVPAQAPLAYVQVERRGNGPLSPSSALQISSTMPQCCV